MVYAGDSIEFVPAVSGASAQRTLKDLLGADFIGGIMVNGRLADLETRLNTGDQIVTSDQPVRPTPPPAAAAPAAEEAAASAPTRARRRPRRHRRSPKKTATA